MRRAKVNLGAFEWEGRRFEPTGPLLGCGVPAPAEGDDGWTVRIIIAGEERWAAIEAMCELIAHAGPLHQQGVVVDDVSETEAAQLILVCPAHLDHESWLSIIATLVDQLSRRVRAEILIEIQRGELTEEAIRIEPR